ncbi:hypothetical protein [Paenibacillus pini]|uniref:Uncharacterized protein n=1 Tax=Paenibacillus pini JCM 16418 TaxID=1236976 RepID=W7Z1L1_9BACL|nr:hypothetical protein [Paenibacillus pini]GAF10871.1 hypothetical protein JCM16418_5099 [Paenibacillus pini JCM 16418]
MGILNDELESITNQYLEETEDNVELELAGFNTEGWTIDNKEMAMKVDYLLNKLEEKNAEDEEISKAQKAPLQAKIDKLEEGKAKIDEWLERSTKSRKANIESLKVHMHLYHQRLIAAEELENEKRVSEGKKPLKISKSIKLTYRDLTSKVKQPEIIKDDSLLTDWVVDNYSDTISLDELKSILKSKEKNEESQVSINELIDLISKAESSYIKREAKLSWGDYKKSLQQKSINIVELDDAGKEVIVGTELIYVDENGSRVPVQLIERGVEYDWKLNK